MRKSLMGFSILELTVVFVIIAVLAAIAISKLFPIQVDAERTSVENVIGGLRSAIGIKVASYIAKDDVAGVRRLVGSNPMDLLSEPPRNYLGTVSAAGVSGVPTGEWYFRHPGRRARLPSGECRLLSRRIRSSGRGAFRRGAGV